VNLPNKCACYKLLSSCCIWISDSYPCGDTKIPGIVKKNYLKYLYKFETLVTFEVLPLRLDAAIPAPLQMLETLSKIFNGNAVKGRQRIALGAVLGLQRPVARGVLRRD
jgi:hypothetical protein